MLPELHCSAASLLAYSLRLLFAAPEMWPAQQTYKSVLGCWFMCYL